ncbi:MAG: LysR family transcriptional regulator [Planctomycetota bacterium]
MHIKSLKIYCDTVALRSFSKAADENGVSQSNASQVVHQLEERLGVDLIDRSTRPFRVTPAGEKYYDGCRAIVRRYEDLELEVRSLHDEVASRLTVAAIYSVGLADMSHHVDAFRSAHPKADVRLEYWHPDQVVAAVESEEADLGIVSYPTKTRRLAAIAWRDERLVLVCAPEHPLTGRSEAPLRAIDGEAFIAFQRDLMIREKIDRLLAKHKVETPVALEFDNIENMKRAIETGAGVSLLPEPTVDREVRAGTLAKVRLDDPTIVRPLGIVHRKDRELSGVAAAFIKRLLGSTDTRPESKSETAKAVSA